MSKAFQKIALLFLLLFVSGEVFAQSIVIDAIEISSSPLTGESKLSSYSSFIENTRSPTLFRTQNSSELSRTNKTIKTGFEIDFIFRFVGKPKHQFVTGFEASSFDSDLYEISGTYQDSLSVSSFLNTKTEFFFLKGGYNYVHTPDKRFTFMAGGVINFGIPVSAKTEEVISLSSDSFDQTRFTFFAKQSPSFGLSFPLGFRFKIINNVSLSFTTSPGFQYQKIDGNPVFTSFKGANFSLHFKLRER